MTSLEKSILEKLKNSLIASTKTSWESGNLDDWTAWAKKMRTTIANSASVMDAMLEEPTKEE